MCVSGGRWNVNANVVDARKSPKGGGERERASSSVGEEKGEGKKEAPTLFMVCGHRRLGDTESQVCLPTSVRMSIRLSRLVTEQADG